MYVCSSQLVVFVNQSYHILKLVRQWDFTGWVLFQLSFRPQKEMVGDGQTIHSGPFFWDTTLLP